MELGDKGKSCPAHLHLRLHENGLRAVTSPNADIRGATWGCSDRDSRSPTPSALEPVRLVEEPHAPEVRNVMG